MANIKEYKKKIKSVKGTLKITSAMKLVAGAKLAKAQQAIFSAKPYDHELQTLVKEILALSSDFEHPYMKASSNKHTLILVISSDRGLCGSYNSQLSKEVYHFVRENSDKNEFKVCFIGKKSKEILKDRIETGELFKFEKAEPSLQEIRQIAEKIGHLFSSGEIGKVFIAYNVFKSAVSFSPTISQMLPIEVSEEEKESIRKKSSADFKFEPVAGKILEQLIPESYINKLWTCLLDAKASEHGSRMSAMDSASKNCKEAIRVKTLQMNKLRQAKITTELIEVVSGAEALNN